MSINDATPSEWDAARDKGEQDAMLRKRALNVAWESARLAQVERVAVSRAEVAEKLGFVEFTVDSADDVIVATTFAPLEDGTGNPKARVGALKVPLHLVPPALSIGAAMALKDGATKYGPYNWRDEPINISTYIGAIQRHILAYQDGEDVAEDSGVDHLGHVAACCALLMDSKAHGSLIDDRHVGKAAELIKGYNK